MRNLLVAVLFATVSSVCSTEARAQAQTADSYVKLCNRTTGPVSAVYTLDDLKGSKPAEIFLAAGGCQYVSLSGYIGKVTVSGKQLNGSSKYFTSVDLSPATSAVVVVTFSTQCAAPMVQGSGYCLQPH